MLGTIISVVLIVVVFLVAFFGNEHPKVKAVLELFRVYGLVTRVRAELRGEDKKGDKEDRPKRSARAILSSILAAAKKVVGFVAKVRLLLAVPRAIIHRFPITIGIAKWGRSEDARVVVLKTRDPRVPGGEFTERKAFHFEPTDIVKIGLFVLMLAYSAYSLITETFSFWTIGVLLVAQVIIIVVHSFDKFNSRWEQRLYAVTLLVYVVVAATNFKGVWGDGGFMLGDVSDTRWTILVGLISSIAFLAYQLVIQPIRYHRLGLDEDIPRSETQLMKAVNGKKPSEEKLPAARVSFGQSDQGQGFGGQAVHETPAVAGSPALSAGGD